MKRITDVKSLIRFRLVSKAWKSLIDSPKFIADQSAGHTQRQHHMLVSYNDESEQKYVSVVDNDSFPQHQFCPTLPSALCRLYFIESMLGSSHGLLCYYGYYEDYDDNDDDDVDDEDDDDDDNDDDEDDEDNEDDGDDDDDQWIMMAVLWNPSIRRSVAIVVPNVLHTPEGRTGVGFGVCPGTSDPKLVKITTHIPISPLESDDVTNFMPWQVEVFTLSSGVWRSPLCTKLPARKSISLSWNPVVINGIIYWLAFEGSVDDSGYDEIISFDLTTEEFEEINFPDTLNTLHLYLANLRGSLAVVDCHKEAETPGCVIWVMNHGGVPKSFTKLYSVKAVPSDSFFNIVREFRKNGDPILETVDDSLKSTLELYEPCSECFIDLGFCGEYPSYVTSYTQ